MPFCTTWFHVNVRFWTTAGASSPTKTSLEPLVSPDAVRGQRRRNATCRPSALMAGLSLELPWVPSMSTLNRLMSRLWIVQEHIRVQIGIVGHKIRCIRLECHVPSFGTDRSISAYAVAFGATRGHANPSRDQRSLSWTYTSSWPFLSSATRFGDGVRYERHVSSPAADRYRCGTAVGLRFVEPKLTLAVTPFDRSCTNTSR